jgi:hypothetical protein
MNCNSCDRKLTGKKKYPNGLCQACYNYFRLGGKVNELPEKGTIACDDRGYPICHICGKAYRKPLSHAWLVHGMHEDEYKEKFGLNACKGVAFEGTREVMRQHIIEHYDVVVIKNLLVGGIKTRFELNSGGRTYDKIRLQAMNKLRRGKKKCMKLERPI